jgi:hypothetical protein
MHKLIVAVALSALTSLNPGCSSPPPLADTSSPEATAVMSAVHAFVSGFNAGDTQAALAVCADAMSIVDEFPPYEWNGSGACLKWIRDYGEDARRNGISDGVVTIHDPRHVDVVGDRAYVVLTADYTYLMQGARMREEGSTFTFALHKPRDAWRITGWCWSKN